MYIVYEMTEEQKTDPVARGRILATFATWVEAKQYESELHQGGNHNVYAAHAPEDRPITEEQLIRAKKRLS